jgi:hypothetical protein
MAMAVWVEFFALQAPARLMLALAAGAAAGVNAQSPRSQEAPVEFAAGEIATTLQGAVSGTDVVRYRLHVFSGQYVSATLAASNPSTHFDIVAPNGGRVVFDGSAGGTHFSSLLGEGGDYTLRVYLAPAAARARENGVYSLEMVLTDLGDLPHNEAGDMPLRGTPTL